MGWIALLVVLATPFVVTYVMEQRRLPVNAKTRKNSGMEFAELPMGVTAYRWIGPVRGPVAVMVHGLTTPSIAYADLAERVGQLGYRVLVYDLYGRGLSDAPRGKQDRKFFLTQLDQLLADQGLEEDITLFGYSMGGSIVTAFAAAQPHRVKRLVLLATAGVLVNESRFSQVCRQVPVFGTWLHHGIGAIRMQNALRDAPEAKGAVLAGQKAELEKRGFFPAVLSSRRGMLDETLEQEHRQIGRANIPVIAIWGGRDPVIPISAMGRLAQWNRLARQEEVREAAHGMPFTHSGEIFEILRTAFREDLGT